MRCDFAKKLFPGTILQSSLVGRKMLFARGPGSQLPTSLSQGFLNNISSGLFPPFPLSGQTQFKTKTWTLCTALKLCAAYVIFDINLKSQSCSSY